MEKELMLSQWEKKDDEWQKDTIIEGGKESRSYYYILL